MIQRRCKKEIGNKKGGQRMLPWLGVGEEDCQSHPPFFGARRIWNIKEMSKNQSITPEAIHQTINVVFIQSSSKTVVGGMKRENRRKKKNWPPCPRPNVISAGHNTIWLL